MIVIIIIFYGYKIIGVVFYSLSINDVKYFFIILKGINIIDEKMINFFVG